jgi:hydroxypyruvate reductase
MSSLREKALDIYEHGLRAVDAEQAVLGRVSVKGDVMLVDGVEYDLTRFRRVTCVGAGKATAGMTKALEGLLGEKLEGGIINVKYGHGLPLSRVRINEAGHPVPDENGLRGSGEIARVLAQLGEEDLVVCLLSGGGSALLTLPAQGITLEDKQKTTALLLGCGARIEEMNAIRKHLSALKGGQLARLAYPAAVVSLILSDVVGDRLDVVASGPTVPDASTFEECLQILKGYGIADDIPSAVRQRLQRGVRGEIPETLKAEDPAFQKVQNVVVASNLQAVEAACRRAREMGFNSVALTSYITGEAREMARLFPAIARQIISTGSPLEAPACVVAGGETTVSIRGEGRGGRNQEMALSAAIEMEGMEGTVLLCGGTDGTDGPTDAAGGIVDGGTLERAGRKGLSAREHLQANDSYSFFRDLGEQFITGPTNTNVMDLYILLVGEE